MIVEAVVPVQVRIDDNGHILSRNTQFFQGVYRFHVLCLGQRMMVGAGPFLIAASGVHQHAGILSRHQIH